VLALAKHPAVARFDLSALATIFSGAAPLGKALAAACTARLGVNVRQGYGLTETSPVTHFHPVGGSVNEPASVGPLVANTEARLVDPLTGVDVARGEPGELWLRGPQVMRGYFNKPEATAACMTPDGWFKTGDVAVADENDWFRIVDRVKELIKYKGLQVAPAELEAVLLSHPAIADAAVIPVQDDDAGEIPKAYIVSRAPITEAEVMEFVAARVSPYKKIRRVEFTDAIPKSPSGKILRRLLVERERGAS
jgi:acyl-CoA synthetase (AMP-forming)/AMP-acid ligase II